ncbi:hypothetical protein [Mangrovihabitans endophyticus]|uniref:Uncharacterized protein n=1 Tax=Mangrovihabitans endophyticus TaxID=1751298 RepID=A0A8J3BXL6_9ACTN|nr:hypothetical protein [Mangrovihabitans endophyticus]GGK88549.1 hypothetical protein GCM10012284_23260 [Mangrovihabitans endophyticus]
MFSRKNKAERTAAQAWEYLSSAMATAGGEAREVGKHTADAAGSGAAAVGAKASELASRAGKTGSKMADKAAKRSSKAAGRASKKGSKLADKAGARVNSAADEAWARANAAANALAGHKPGLPWGLIVGVGLLGAALGWAAATSARAALERQAEREEIELAETAVVVTPTLDD